MGLDALGGTQRLQQRHIAGGLCAEGKVVPAEHRPGRKAAHQHLPDEILRREGAEIGKGGLLVFGDAQLRHPAVLFPVGEDAPALEGVVRRQREGERRRGQPVGGGIVHRRPQHRPVAQVDAVKKAQRHRAAMGRVDGGKRGQDVHAVNPLPSRRTVFRRSARRPPPRPGQGSGRPRHRRGSGRRRPGSGWWGSR